MVTIFKEQKYKNLSGILTAIPEIFINTSLRQKRVRPTAGYPGKRTLPRSNRSPGKIRKSVRIL